MKPLKWIIVPVLCLGLAGVIPPTAVQAAAAQGKAKKRGAKRMALYAPSGYDKMAILIHKGKESKYYLFTQETPLKLEVQGPTTLSVHVRLLYDMTMKGAQNFTVAIEESGLLARQSEVTSHGFTAQKSPTSTLKDETGVVPSKSERFKLEVPNGKHQYTIRLRNTSARSAAARILIPRKDIQSAPKEGLP